MVSTDAVFKLFMMYSFTEPATQPPFAMPSSSSPSTSTNVGTSDSSNSNSDAAVIGTVVGVCLLVILAFFTVVILLLVLFFYNRRAQVQQQWGKDLEFQVDKDII